MRMKEKNKYHLHAIITRGFHILYPIFKDHFFDIKEVFFQKIMSLYTVSIQEQFVIKSGLC